MITLKETDAVVIGVGWTGSILARELTKAGLNVVLQEAKKVIALYEVDLAGVQSFSGYFVRFAGDSGAQSQYLSWLSKFHNHGSAVRRVNGKLHAAFAEHEDAAWHLSFDKQHSPLRIRRRVLDAFKGVQRGCWQIAEDPIRP